MSDLPYTLVKYVHVVCAVIWVGGAFLSQILALRAQRSTDPTELPKLGKGLSDVGMKVFLPASLVLFVAGVIMVIHSFAFGQTWIAISVALWIVSAASGALYLGPRAAKVATMFEAEGPGSVAGRALLGQILIVSRVELVSFAVIIFLMIAKPV
jgi:uncharacterized membrane protein